MATTTPTFGRGMATTLLQAAQLLRLTDEHATDAGALGESFDAWCAPAIRGVIGGYLGMTALPSSLRVAELRARALYASGWRPRPAPGPSRAELAEIICAALRAAPAAALPAPALPAPALVVPALIAPVSRTRLLTGTGRSSP